MPLVSGNLIRFFRLSRRFFKKSLIKRVLDKRKLTKKDRFYDTRSTKSTRSRKN